MNPVARVIRWHRSRKPVPEYLGFSSKPVAGRTFSVIARAQRVGNHNLEVSQGGNVLFAGNPYGKVAVTPASSAMLRVAQTLWSLDGSKRVDHELNVPVKDNPPRMRIRRPLWMRVGQMRVITCKASNADAIKVDVSGAGLSEQRIGPPGTAFAICPTEPGIILAQVTGRNQTSSRTRAVIIRVFAARLTLTVENDTQAAKEGDTVSFIWRCTGEVWLESPLRGERHRVSQAGFVSVTVGREPEELRLVVRNKWRTKTRTLRVIPRSLAGLDS